MPPPLTFAVKVKPSRKHSLKGSYQAKVDRHGLRLSRKKDAIDIPVGTPAEYLTGPSLRVEHDGADVELTVVRVGWYCDRLARDLAEYVTGDGLIPHARDYQLPGYLWVLALLPVGIPILTVGGAIWGGLGAGLAALCFAVASRERWPVALRVVVMLLASAAGYGTLLAVVLFLAFNAPDPSGPPPRNAPVVVNRPAVPFQPAVLPVPPRIDFAGQRVVIDAEGIPGWLGFTPDGQTLVVGASGLNTYDAATGVAKGKQLSLEDGLRYADFSPDGQRIVAGGYKGGPVVLGLADGAVVSRCEAGPDPVRDAAFRGDGKTVLGAEGTHLVEWDADTGKRLRQLGPSAAGLRVVQIRQEGKLVITAGHLPDGADRRLDQVWSLEKGVPVADLPPFTSAWNSSNGRGGYDLVRRPVSPQPGEPRGAFAVSPDGRFAVLTQETGAVVLPMDLAAGKQLPDFMCGKPPSGGTFTPDGSVFAVGKLEGGIDLVELPSAKRIGSLTPGKWGLMVFSLAFAPDGRHLAIGTSGFGGDEHKVYVVDLEQALPGWRPRPAAGR